MMLPNSLRLHGFSHPSRLEGRWEAHGIHLVHRHRPGPRAGAPQAQWATSTGPSRRRWPRNLSRATAGAVLSWVTSDSIVVTRDCSRATSLISIRDNATGIPAEVKDKMF